MRREATACCLARERVEQGNRRVGESRTYPLQGSLGDEVFSSTESELVTRFGIEGSLVDPSQEGGPLPEAVANLNRLRFFFSGSELVSVEDPFDLSRWSYSPTHNALITWKFTPDCTYPTHARFAVEVATPAKLETQLRRVGLPVPSSEPQVLVGTIYDDLRHVVFKPGPPGLATLQYAVYRREGRCCVIALCERPPEPDFSKLVEKYRSDFPYQGIRFYDSFANANAGEKWTEITPSYLPLRLI